MRGDVDLSTMPGIDGFAHLHDFVPPGLPSWTRNDARDADAPFVARLEDDEGRAVAKWGRLPLTVAPRDVHVFDMDTRRAIASD